MRIPALNHLARPGVPLTERKLDIWADPRQSRPGEINSNDGGRGCYFLDPAGNYLEILTRPYGSGPRGHSSFGPYDRPP